VAGFNSKNVILETAGLKEPSIGEISISTNGEKIIYRNSSGSYYVANETFVESVSGSLQSQIDNLEVNVDLSDYTLLTTTEAISSNLQSQIDNLEVNVDLSEYTLLTTTEAISSNLQSQIDNLEVGNVESASRVSFTIDQVDHGFIVGQWVRSNGTTWQLAQSNTADDSETLGVVTAVTQNNFTITHSGYVEIDGWNIMSGNVYFLSPTVGGQITLDEPSLNSEISKPVLYALSNNTGIVYSMRGDLISELEFVDTSSSQDISGGKSFINLIYLSGVNKNIKEVSGTYDILTTDYTILANSTSNNVTINLPENPTNGRYIVVKKISSNNQVIISPNTKQIELSVSNYTISTNLESVSLHYYSGSWYKV